jgi:DNA-binding MarR family transcriptional regulator
MRTAWDALTHLFITENRFMTAADALGLQHPGSLRLLLSLDPSDPPPMRRLADLLRCDPSWVTALVDSLEASGYVCRMASSIDRRVKRVELTKAGRDAQSRAIEILGTPPPSFHVLSAAEAKSLAALLTKVVGDTGAPVDG